jgi:hypothetical protein
MTPNPSLEGTSTGWPLREWYMFHCAAGSGPLSSNG